MHFTFRRFLVLLTPLAAVIATVLFAGGGGQTIRTLAAGPTPGPAPVLTGVSCADVFLDSGFPGAATGLPFDLNGNTIAGDDGDITSLTMTRTEPSQTQAGKWDVSTVSYLGRPPAAALGALGTLVPGGPPGPGCQTASTAAATSAEANRFGGLFEVPYSNQYGVRPGSVATYNAGTQMLSSSSCGFSESQALWIRIDNSTHITKTGPGAKNSGTGTLYLGAGAPATPVDTNGDTIGDAAAVGTDCAVGGFAFHFVYTAHARDPRTDHTTLPKNSTILQDPDGPHPKVKGTDQLPDSADALADDWDGDGCPDWDELDKGYMPPTLPLLFPPTITTPVNGLDPFNPYDCDANWTSTISLTTTIVHNTSTAFPGNGQYFRCIGSVTQTKSGTVQPLNYKLGCYSDSTVTVVNSSNPLVPHDPSRAEDGAAAGTCGDSIDNGPDGKMDAADSDCHPNICGSPQPTFAPSYMCGDGRAGVAPPGCVGNPAVPTWCADATAGGCALPLPCKTARFAFVGIDPATYPVVNPPTGNNYDTTTNQIHLGGCFAGFGGGAFGNVFGSSTIDAHTGAGSFQIFLNQTLTNCQNGTPMGTPINGTVTIVELRDEKNLPTNCPANTGGGSDCHKYDSDRDGCADARELGNGASAQTSGGFRDPYNQYDYFDPEKVGTPGLQTVADILKVVSQFGKNQGNPAYNMATDRTGVLGGQGWNLGPPDGQQTVADILASVKQFGNNCPRVTP